MKRTVLRTPIVLVHGWAGSAESWQPVIERLDPAEWDAVAVRLPGSRSGMPGDPTVTGAAELVIDLLNQTPDRALLVGHSMGAQATLLAHGRAPQRVLSEIVIDPAYAGAAESRDEMEAWAQRIRREGHTAVADFFRSATRGMTAASAERIMTDLCDTTPAAIASYLRSEYVDADAIGLEPATARTATRRRSPVLSVHSTDASARREAGLPAPRGSRSETWRSHGHYLHLEDPERFVALLGTWRDELLPSGVLTGAQERQPG